MEGSTVKPFILTDAGGKVHYFGKMNEKGYRKSLENNTLWILHPETERLLPMDGEPAFTNLTESEEFFSAQLKGASETIEKKSHQVAVDGPDVLAKLWKVVQQRKVDMPEGSYTTHLFQKGTEKIKKKLGEEAVEVILTKNKEELVYESADLIYHLFVLLTEQEVDLEDIYQELAGRAK